MLVRVFRQGTNAVIEVRDDGPGFPPDVDVLARYVTGPRGGTGLWLPLVLWIAQQHRATVALENGPADEPGALVTLVMPLAVDPQIGGRPVLRRARGRQALTPGERPRS